MYKRPQRLRLRQKMEIFGFTTLGDYAKSQSARFPFPFFSNQNQVLRMSSYTGIAET
jgi:hypothetical protein